MINYSTQPSFTHLPNCDFLLHFISNVQLCTTCHIIGVSSLASTLLLHRVPAKQKILFLYFCWNIFKHIPAEHHGKGGKRCIAIGNLPSWFPKRYIHSTAPIDYSEYIYWEQLRHGLGEKGGIYDSQPSRLIHFLITVNYIGIACRVVKFKAKTNSEPCLLKTQRRKDIVWINSTFSSTLPHRNWRRLY